MAEVQWIQRLHVLPGVRVIDYDPASLTREVLLGAEMFPTHWGAPDRVSVVEQRICPICKHAIEDALAFVHVDWAADVDCFACFAKYQARHIAQNCFSK